MHGGAGLSRPPAPTSARMVPVCRLPDGQFYRGFRLNRTNLCNDGAKGPQKPLLDKGTECQDSGLRDGESCKVRRLPQPRLALKIKIQVLREYLVSTQVGREQKLLMLRFSRRPLPYREDSQMRQQDRKRWGRVLRRSRRAWPHVCHHAGS